MRILVIGRGPVAQVLLSGLDPAYQAVVGVREARISELEIRVRRAGRYSREVRRRVPAVTVGRAALDTWDVVVTTAPVLLSGLPELLRHSPGAVVASVTQVPSEVEALREVAAQSPAGAQSWGLLTPEFLATRGIPVRWWQPGRLSFTLAGPAAPHLRRALGDAQVRLRQVELAAPLLGAATTMPFVAGLHVAQYHWPVAQRQVAALSQAATQARAAVAAEYSGSQPKPMRPLWPALALRALPYAVPLDLKAYVRAHFGGHVGQTQQMLADWIALGQRHGLATDALEALDTALGAAE